MKDRVLVAVIVLVVGAAAVWPWLGPGIHVTVQQELVGSEDKVVILVQQGASLEEVQAGVRRSGKHVDEISWFGESLLYYAVDVRRIDVAEWLLKEGADPNGIYRARVPLERAIHQEHLAMVKLLIEFGADPDLDTGHGITPRRIAESGGNPKILSALPPSAKPTTTSSPAAVGSSAPAAQPRL